MRKPGVCLLVAALTLVACGTVATAAGTDSPSQGVGLVLQALSQEDLDAIESESGYRVGVLVTGVRPGSAAADEGRELRLVSGGRGELWKEAE